MKRKVIAIVVVITICLSFTCVAFAKNVYVKGYTKKDDTYVEPHYRTSPDADFWNNWSSKGNVNPDTGKDGYKLSQEYKASGFIPNYTVDTSPLPSYTTFYTNLGDGYVMTLAGFKQKILYDDYAGPVAIEKNYYKITAVKDSLTTDERTNLRSMVSYSIRLLLSGDYKLLRDDDIAYLQIKLIEMGYDCGNIDGVMGEKTFSALRQLVLDYLNRVNNQLQRLGYLKPNEDMQSSAFFEGIRRFQYNHKIRADGIINPVTLALLGV